MNALGRGLNSARAAVNRSAAPAVLPDLCDIFTTGLVSDGHSGQSTGESLVAQDLPVEVEDATPGGAQIVAGGQTYQATHRLKFGYSAVTVAIRPEHIVKIKARGVVGEFVFEKPVPVKGSSSVWLYYSAVLVTGFRSPANV